MQIKSEKIIFKLITLSPIVVLTTLSILFLTLFYNYEINRFNQEMDQLKINYFANQKTIIKKETQEVINIIMLAKESLQNLGMTQSEAKQHILKRISKIRYGKHGYFFIYNFNGVNLMHPIKPQLVGKNLYNLQDKNGEFLIQDLILSAKNNGQYVKYIWDHPQTKKAEDKLGYALAINDWNWMVGTGVYLHDIQNVIYKKQLLQKAKLKHTLAYIFLIVITIILFTSFFSYIFLNKLKDIIFQYKNKIEEQNEKLEIEVDKQTKELSELNENLEQRIVIEVDKNAKQQHQLLQSEKMASMGEMIGNIAHQWRQPLSSISMTSGTMILEKKMGILTDEEFIEKNESIINNTQFLSETIETFTNFIKENNERTKIILQERIETTLHIISSTLKSKHITLINNCNLVDPISITTSAGELSQVIINIINNAKDILLEKKIVDSTIEINLNVEKNKVILTIEDNAGGIADEVMPKIFEPYFTTKHKSQGTGLGLHMSYQIVTQSLNGQLYAKNSKSGAKFFIELPIN